MENKKTIDLNININVSPQPGDIEKKEYLNGQDHPKIKVSMSVAQLAYFFRMLSDLGYIKTNKNSVTDVIRCVIKNISTPKADVISFESFKTKFYNPEVSTKQSVKEAVMKQLNFLRKELNN